MNGYFSVSEFAKLTSSSRDTLLYYDKIGLLKPSFKAVNGYRYYSYQQYENYQIIDALKQLGLSLLKIKEHLDKKSPRNLFKLISDAEIDLDLKIKRLTDLKKALSLEKKEVKDAIENLNTFKVMEVEETYYVQIEGTINSDETFINAYQELDKISRENNINSNYFVGTYGKFDSVEILKSTNDDDQKVVYDGIYSIILEEVPLSVKREKGTYLVTYVYNNYEREVAIFKKALDFANEHDLVLTSPFYNESIGGVFNTDDNPLYLSKYLFTLK